MQGQSAAGCLSVGRALFFQQINTPSRPTIKPFRDIAGKLVLAPTHLLADLNQAPSHTADPQIARLRPVVYRTRLQPHWLADGRLWYTIDSGPGTREWVLVEADGKLQRFADSAQLQAALGLGVRMDAPLQLAPSPRRGEQTDEPVTLLFQNRSGAAFRLSWLGPSGWEPYDLVSAGTELQRSTYAGHIWRVDGPRGTPLGFVTAPFENAVVDVEGAVVPARHTPGMSPDGRWMAFTRGDDVWVRPIPGQGEPTRLSTDGVPGDSYSGTAFFWSPDSSKLVAFRARPAQERRLDLVSSARDGMGMPRTISVPYLVPGDRIPHPRPVLFDLANRTSRTVPDALFPNPWALHALTRFDRVNGVTWATDSSRFWFAYNQRGHQLMRVIVVDAASGEASTLFEESSNTFIDYSNKYWAHYLPASAEILWMSERDGWNHLYVRDAITGAVKRRLTAGDWVVRGVDGVDEQAGTLIARVSGRRPGEDPYHQHVVRIALADGALTPLTEGDGTHRLTFSPDGSRYIDRWARVDVPPVHELRRTRDGKLLATLERVDPDALRAAGRRTPERFVAKGRDSVTDIWGIVVRPPDFDPAQCYPVVEKIYAGPHDHSVPKDWDTVSADVESLAARGFIVVQIDGMGTNWRSRVFQDVAWKNLKDAGFPDRIAWIRALAAKYPHNVDLDRVGVFGGSAGGQNAVAALIWHHDFYKAAVADSGCHDNRLDKIWWNEAWMGWPVDRAYEDSSNIVHAAELQGHLLLTFGDLDANVDPVATRRLAQALRDAGKHFELKAVAGGGHGVLESEEGRRRLVTFFSAHLISASD